MNQTIIYPRAAQFLLDDPVTLTIENPPETYRLQVTCLEKTVFCQEIPGEASINLGRFPAGGYGVTLTAGDVMARTAFDVAKTKTDYLRYGFLSEFDTQDRKDDRDVRFLLRCHTNIVQFYDWMYRHHELIPPTEKYLDALGRQLDFSTVREKINACRSAGMQSIAYAAIYASEQEYGHPEQVMLASDGSHYQMIDLIDMMLYDHDGPWTDHITGEFRKALESVGFDGLHLDQYGYPKFAYRGSVAPENIFDAENEFAPFLKRLRAEFPEAVLIFNAVNSWPLELIAPCPVDAVYIEVWNPHDSYYQLQRLVEDGRQFGKRKPVILAAYLSPFETCTAENEKQLAATFCLAQAAIYANGGSQLVLGEDGGILKGAYYCDYAKLHDPELAIRYANFQVRYRNLLFDKALDPVGKYYCGEGNGDLTIEEAPVSCDGRIGTIWVLINKKPHVKVIHLINLMEQTDDKWNSLKETVQPHDVHIQLLCEDIRSAYMASPDGDPDMKPVEFERTPVLGGSAYRLHIPDLKAWTVLYIEHE